jgi:hypothetical protein
MPQVNRDPSRNEIVEAASGVFGIRPSDLCAEGMGVVSSELCCAAAARCRMASAGPSKECTPSAGCIVMIPVQHCRTIKQRQEALFGVVGVCRYTHKAASACTSPAALYCGLLCCSLQPPSGDVQRLEAICTSRPLDTSDTFSPICYPIIQPGVQVAEYSPRSSYRSVRQVLPLPRSLTRINRLWQDYAHRIYPFEILLPCGSRNR